MKTPDREGGIRKPIVPEGVPEFSTFGELFQAVKGVASNASLYAAIIFMIIAGYTYIVARGEEAEYTKARGSLVSIGVGLGFIGISSTAVDALSGSMGGAEAFKGAAFTFWQNVLEPIVGFLTILGLAWAVLMFVMAGFSLVTSSGDEADMKKAKARLLYGAIGLVVIGLSKSAVAIFSTTGRIHGDVLDVTTKEGEALGMGLKSELLMPIMNLIVSFVGAVAIAMFVKAGYEFLTAQGDSKKIENAKNSLQYGIVGLLVIGLAETAIGSIFKLQNGHLTISSSEGVKFIFQIINFALSFLGAIAIGMVVYAGFLYITDRGEGSGKKKAQDILQYATIGILVIIFAYAIVNIFITGGRAG